MAGRPRKPRSQRREMDVRIRVTEEERQRVSDHIKAADPSYDSVVQAVQGKK